MSDERTTSQRMDEWIRGARTTTAPGRHLGGQRAAGETGNAQASDDQLTAARAAGLPDELAHRLRGDDLRGDADTLRQDLGIEPPPRVDFDGGARGSGPARTVASMDDQLRRALDNRRMFGGVLPSDDGLSHLHTS